MLFSFGNRPVSIAGLFFCFKGGCFHPTILLQNTYKPKCYNFRSTKQQKQMKYFITLCAFALVLFACKEEKPTPPNTPIASGTPFSPIVGTWYWYEECCNIVPCSTLVNSWYFHYTSDGFYWKTNHLGASISDTFTYEFDGQQLQLYEIPSGDPGGTGTYYINGDTMVADLGICTNPIAEYRYYRVN